MASMSRTQIRVGSEDTLKTQQFISRVQRYKQQQKASMGDNSRFASSSFSHLDASCAFRLTRTFSYFKNRNNCLYFFLLGEQVLNAGNKFQTSGSPSSRNDSVNVSFNFRSAQLGSIESFHWEESLRVRRYRRA